MTALTAAGPLGDQASAWLYFLCDPKPGTDGAKGLYQEQLAQRLQKDTVSVVLDSLYCLIMHF